MLNILNIIRPHTFLFNNETYETENNFRFETYKSPKYIPLYQFTSNVSCKGGHYDNMYLALLKIKYTPEGKTAKHVLSSALRFYSQPIQDSVSLISTKIWMKQVLMSIFKNIIRHVIKNNLQFVNIPATPIHKYDVVRRDALKDFLLHHQSNYNGEYDLFVRKLKQTLLWQSRCILMDKNYNVLLSLAIKKEKLLSLYKILFENVFLQKDIPIPLDFFVLTYDPVIYETRSPVRALGTALDNVKKYLDEQNTVINVIEYKYNLIENCIIPKTPKLETLDEQYTILKDKLFTALKVYL